MTTTAPRADASGDGFTVVEPPRNRYAPGRAANRGGINTEMYLWIFQRVSGLLLVVLVLGHLLIMTVLDGGVARINFAFVAGRWASPYWQAWDLAQLWLAQLHGAVGLRTIINDYATKSGTRFWLQTLLWVASVLVIGLGTLVIFTFDPELS